MNVLGERQKCNVCSKDMRLVAVTGSRACNDGFHWGYSVKILGKGHERATSIRAKLWFAASNLTIKAILLLRTTGAADYHKIMLCMN